VGLIPDDIIAQVRERTDIAQVIGEHVALAKSGAQLRGLCPFHSERTGSFYVYPAKQFFICYGCGKKGDVFSFLMEQQGRTFLEAVKDLAQRAGIELPAESPEALRQNRAARSERERLLKANAIACDFFRAQYLGAGGARARDYVERRGVTAPTGEIFRLGYAPATGEALAQHLARHKVPTALADQAGLIAPSQRGAGYYDRFRDRLMFPVISPAGEVLGFSGRLLDPDAKAAKYVNSPETPLYRKGDLLFGLHAARATVHRTGRAVLVEGNFDVVQLHERGLTDAVAPLGTALTERQVALLRRHVGDGHVVVLFDGDDAGQKATSRAIPLLVTSGIEARVARCPRGEDPDSLARKDAGGQIARLVDHAVPAVEYLIDETSLAHTSSVEGRVKALRAIAPTLRLLKDPAVRDLYAGRVAAALTIEKRAVDRAIRLSEVPTPSPADPAAPRPAPRAARLGPALDRELRLLSLLSDHPELCDAAAPAEELLTQAPVKAAFRALRETRPGELADEVVLRALPEELRATLAERLLAGSFSADDSFGQVDAPRALAEIVQTLEGESRGQTILELTREIEEAQRDGDTERYRRLTMRKLELARERHQVASR
jgi:DNA primase